MDSKNQKERLEQELKFLKESFEADVISKEEFERGKIRIEKKLAEIHDQITDSTEESKKQEEIDVAKLEESKSTQQKEIRDGDEITKEYAKKNSDALKEIEKANPSEESGTSDGKNKAERKERNFFMYGAIFIVLILVAFFSYSSMKGSEPEPQKITNKTILVAACDNDENCTQQGMEGLCMDPGTEKAKCEFTEAKKIKVVVLNDRENCFNCDTQRVLSILQTWFGKLEIEEIDYNTADGMTLAEGLDAKLLPAYLLDQSITENANFKEFEHIFVNRGGFYMLGEDAASSAFYFKRPDMPNRLELFVKLDEDSSIKAEKNIKELLDTSNEIEFYKHLSTENLTKDLSIRTFPTFLINNRVKFTGVHSAETIKENFCKLNKIGACGKNLSKSLA